MVTDIIKKNNNEEHNSKNKWLNPFQKVSLRTAILRAKMMCQSDHAFPSLGTANADDTITTVGVWKISGLPSLMAL